MVTSIYIDINLPEGDINLPEGDTNLPEGDTNLPEGDTNLPENDINLPEGDINLPEGDINLPEEGDTNLPEDDINLPDGDINLPEGDTNLPEDDINLPEGDINLPEGDTNLPEDDINLPEGDINLPEGDINVPEGDSNLPEDDINLPEGDTNLPEGDIILPEGDINLPEGDTNYQRMTSIYQRVTSIYIDINLPEGDINLPEGDISLPEGDINLPEGDINLPEGDINLPEYDINLPECDINLPEGDINLPDDDINLPEGDINLPEVDINLPEFDINLPEGDTNLPEDDINLPEGDINLPEGDINLPEGDTNLPEGDTNLPEGDINLPEGVQGNVSPVQSVGCQVCYRDDDNDTEAAQSNPQSQSDDIKEIDQLFSSCELNRMIQDIIGNYIMMEEYFMREMIVKAVNMDSSEEGQQTSSMVDDIFFIVKKSVRRAISSSSVDGVCAMLNHACTILEKDFGEVLLSRLRAGYPYGFDLQHAYNIVQSSLQHGKLQSSDSKARSQFLTALNNVEVSCDYCKALKTNLEEDISKLYPQCSEQSKAKLESCLGEVITVAMKFKDIVDFGFSQLASSAVKPRIKPLIDSFLSTSHNISEEEFSNYEANDPWVQNVIMNLDTALTTFKEAMTSSNYDRFATAVSGEITQQLEKAVTKTTFNRLGGLQFDKELRSLVGYLSSVTTWTVRDKFSRLMQMATILNLERVSEIMDYWGQNSGPLTWRLTPTEVRQILSLRIDFRTDDIKRLKL
ncbi:Golgi transport complex subunit 4 [Bulinus truncatus]|nr:Golgi transport complex subunit 4 [Bulinus truncatus]